MITIRLQRRGRKNDPSFRVIVVESKRAAKTGDFLEVVGNYDPRVNRVELKADRIKHWIKEGAQTSDTVHNLLISKKIIEGKKINVLPRKSPPKKEIEEVAAASAAPAEVPVAESADLPAEALAEVGAPAEEESAPVEAPATETTA